MNEPQRDKLGDAVRLLLDITQEIKMRCAMARGLDMAIHDGAGRRDAQAVGGRDHLRPVGNGDPARGNELANLVVEDFGGSPWQ